MVFVGILFLVCTWAGFPGCHHLSGQATLRDVVQASLQEVRNLTMDIARDTVEFSSGVDKAVLQEMRKLDRSMEMQQDQPELSGDIPNWNFSVAVHDLNVYHIPPSYTYACYLCTYGGDIYVIMENTTAPGEVAFERCFFWWDLRQMAQDPLVDEVSLGYFLTGSSCYEGRVLQLFRMGVLTPGRHTGHNISLLVDTIYEEAHRWKEHYGIDLIFNKRGHTYSGNHYNGSEDGIHPDPHVAFYQTAREQQAQRATNKIRVHSDEVL